jgi:hypothetical protein
MVTWRWALYLLSAGEPTAALWIYQTLQAAHDFAGTCGLLDTGRACSKAQYVKFTLFSPFAFACLAAVSVGWLIVVAIATWKYARLRKRREGT